MATPIDLIPEEPTLADWAQSGPAAETEAAKAAQHFHDLANIGEEQAQAHQTYAEKKASLPQIHQDPEPDVPMSHKEELKPAPKLLASHPEQALPNGHTRESLEALYTSDPLKYHELMAQFLHEKAQLWTEGPGGYREIARKFEAERGPIGTPATPKAVEGVGRGIASARAPHATPPTESAGPTAPSPVRSAGPTAPSPVRRGVENTPPSPKKSPGYYRGVEAVGNALKEGGNPPKGAESPKTNPSKVLDLSRRSPNLSGSYKSPGTRLGQDDLSGGVRTSGAGEGSSHPILAGAIEGVQDTGRGVLDTLRHPVDSVVALGKQAVTHPIDTLGEVSGLGPLARVGGRLSAAEQGNLKETAKGVTEDLLAAAPAAAGVKGLKGVAARRAAALRADAAEAANARLGKTNMKGEPSKVAPDPNAPKNTGYTNPPADTKSQMSNPRTEAALKGIKNPGYVYHGAGPLDNVTLNAERQAAFQKQADIGKKGRVVPTDKARESSLRAAQENMDTLKSELAAGNVKEPKKGHTVPGPASRKKSWTYRSPQSPGRSWTYRSPRSPGR